MSNNKRRHSHTNRSSSTEGRKERTLGKKQPWTQRFEIGFVEYPPRSTAESQNIEVELKLDDSKNEHQIREQLIDKVPLLTDKSLSFFVKDIHGDSYSCPCSYDCRSTNCRQEVKEWNGINIRKCTKRNQRRVFVICEEPEPAYSEHPASEARNLNPSPSLPLNVQGSVVQHSIPVHSSTVDETRRAAVNNVSNLDQNFNNQDDDKRISDDSAYYTPHEDSTTTEMNADNFLSEEHQQSPSIDLPMEIMEYLFEKPSQTGRKLPVIIKSITPDSCDVKGGKPLFAELEALLSEWNINGSVRGQFGNSDAVYPEMLNGRCFKFIIPPSRTGPGIVPFQLLGENNLPISYPVDFEYRSKQQNLEEALVAVFDSEGTERVNNAVKKIATLMSKRATDKSGEKGCKGPADPVMELSVLRAIVEIAAVTNNMELFAVIFGTPVGTNVFKSFKDDMITLDGVAREFGHHELAEFLAEKHLKYKDFESDSDNEVNWNALAKALEKHQRGENDSNRSSSSSYGFESDDESSSSILSEISNVDSSIKEPCLDQEAASDLKENHENSHLPPAYVSRDDSIESSSISYGFESDDENSSSILSEISSVHSSIKQLCLEQKVALHVKENHKDPHLPLAYVSQAPIVCFGKPGSNLVHGEYDNITSNKLAPFFRKDLVLYGSMMETNALEKRQDQNVLTNLYMRTRSDRAINFSESSKKMPVFGGLKGEVEAGSSYTKKGELNLQRVEAGVEVTCKFVGDSQLLEYTSHRVRASSDSRLLKNESRIFIEGVGRASVSEPTLQTTVLSIADEDTTNLEDLFSEEYELFRGRGSVLSFLKQHRYLTAGFMILITALLCIMAFAIVYVSQAKLTTSPTESNLAQENTHIYSTKSTTSPTESNVAQENTHIYSKPSAAPQNVTGHNTSSTSILVWWDEVPVDQRNGIITAYTITYQSQTENHNGNVQPGPNDRQKEITGLKEYVDYNITVFASNVKGDGPHSTPVLVVRTDQNKPDGAPQNVRGLNTSSTSILVLWDEVPVDRQNGIITSYTITYQSQTKNHNGNMSAGSSERQKNITGLKEYVDYNITVFASTVKGNGPQSTPVLVVRTDQNKPSGAPQNVTGHNTSSSSILVWWDEVPVDQRNGIIKGYTITYQSQTENHNGNVQAGPNDRQKEITGLKEYVDYNIIVFASNVKGDGPHSTPVLVVRTDQNKPDGAPQNVRGINTSSTSILVFWDEVPVDQQNGIITSYTITYQSQTENHNGNMSAGSSERQKNITGLKEYVDYNITVFASTVKGNGPQSTPVLVVRTDQNRPTHSDNNYQSSLEAKINEKAILPCPVFQDVMNKDGGYKYVSWFICTSEGSCDGEDTRWNWISGMSRQGGQLSERKGKSISSDGSLHIRKVHPRDLTKYRCKVSRINYESPLVYDVALTRKENASTCTDAYCKNGGTCYLFQEIAKCICPASFTGDTCEIDVDECQVLANPCRNGATCTNFIGGYTCRCVYGWEGFDCSINVDDCQLLSGIPLCFNGGTCIDRLGKFDCHCAFGFQGPMCQFVDECYSNPCDGNMICSTDAFGQHSCSCRTGWTGNKCSIDINECTVSILSPCHHNGTCVNTPGSFHCQCAPGYTGKRCEVSVNDCSSNPCKNGAQCLDYVNGFKCLCVDGWTGPVCDHYKITECLRNPCLNVSPNIVHGPQNVTVKETEKINVTLYCNATGRPAARLSWIRVKDGKTVASGHTLLITAAQRSDLGEYRCLAENGVGNPATKSFYLDVHYSPSSTKLTTNKVNSIFYGNDRIVLTCVTDANPPASQYRFYRDGVHLRTILTGKYVIQKARQTHPGTYQCVPINELGTGFNSSVAVVVIGAFSIIHFPRNTTVNENGNATFFCNATSYPPYQALATHITWSKLGDSSKVFPPGEKLVLHDVGKHDAGTYICKAENGLGRPDTAPAVLIVQRTEVDSYMEICAMEEMELICPPRNLAIQRNEYQSLLWSVSDPYGPNTKRKFILYCGENPMNCIRYPLGGFSKRIIVRRNSLGGRLYVKHLNMHDRLSYTCIVKLKDNKPPLAYQVNVSSSVYCLTARAGQDLNLCPQEFGKTSTSKELIEDIWWSTIQADGRKESFLYCNSKSCQFLNNSFPDYLRRLKPDGSSLILRNVRQDDIGLQFQRRIEPNTKSGAKLMPRFYTVKIKNVLPSDLNNAMTYTTFYSRATQHPEAITSAGDRVSVSVAVLVGLVMALYITLKLC